MLMIFATYNDILHLFSSDLSWNRGYRATH